MLLQENIYEENIAGNSGKEKKMNTLREKLEEKYYRNSKIRSIMQRKIRCRQNQAVILRIGQLFTEELHL